MDVKHQKELSLRFNQKSPLFNTLFFYKIWETAIFAHFLGWEKPCAMRALSGTETQTFVSILSLDTKD